MKLNIWFIILLFSVNAAASEEIIQRFFVETTDGTNDYEYVDYLVYGTHTNASDQIDKELGENEEPRFPPPGLGVVDIAGGNGGCQHFFQAHGLGAKLGLIAMIVLFVTAFVFNGGGLVKAFPSRQLNAFRRGGKFHHITHSG